MAAKRRTRPCASTLAADESCKCFFCISVDCSVPTVVLTVVLLGA